MNFSVRILLCGITLLLLNNLEIYGISLISPFFLTDSLSQIDTAAAKEKYEKGIEYYGSALYDDAVELFNKARSMYEKDKNWAKVIECINMISECYWRSGNLNKGKELINKAVKIVRLNPDKNLPEIAGGYKSLGIIYILQTKLDSAEIYLNKAVGVIIDNYGRDNFRAASIYTALGNLNFYKGKFDKSIEYHKKAYDIDTLNFGIEYKNVGNDYLNIALCYSNKGDFELALVYYNKALQIYLNSKGNTYNTAVLYIDMAYCYLELGVYDKSFFYNDKALKILYEDINKKNDIVISANYGIADTYMAIKKYDINN